MSYHFAKALSAGRGATRLTRENILAALLRKRAEARRVGFEQEEALLRQQILWALPMRQPKDDEPD